MLRHGQLCVAQAAAAHLHFLDEAVEVLLFEVARFQELIDGLAVLIKGSYGRGKPYVENSLNVPLASEAALLHWR